MSAPLQLKDHDTIVALATGPSHGAIAIVRLSGPDALPIFQKISQERILLQDRQVSVGYVYDAKGQVIDFAVCLYFKGPRSFTGDDVVEMQLHASSIVVQKIIDHCIQCGARSAEAGEFSKRAYLNGKADLTKLEATADLIAAHSEAEALAAMRTMQGAFADEVTAISKHIMHLRMMLEAHMDFTDEDIAPEEIHVLHQAAQETVQQLNRLVEQTHQGSLLRDGMHVVIVGAPNVGKSSLMNALAKQQRSIVSDIAGTTRDIIRDYVMLGPLKINLSDTAGLCDAKDTIEQQGIALAKASMQTADVIWLMMDSQRIQAGDTTVLQDIQSISQWLPKHAQLIILENKIDQTGVKPGKTHVYDYEAVALSVKDAKGLHDLQQLMIDKAGMHIADSTLLVKDRHRQCLIKAQEALQNGYDYFNAHQALELFAEDCAQAQMALEPILGKTTTDDVLGEIFSHFCIGK